MKKAALAALFLFFNLCFLVSPAAAISIAPAKITMDFVPGYEAEFDGFITNTQDVEVAFDVYTDGELMGYMTLLTPGIITLSPGQTANYKFKIKLPSAFEIPGPHTGIIWASQHVEEPTGEGIAIRLKAGTKVVVNVPYPGKYVEMKLDIKNAKVNDTVLFEITATNLGKENITSAKGEIKLMDSVNRTLVILQTAAKPIISTQSETLQATWFSDAEPGLYQAEASVFYDGETASSRTTFNLGAPLVKIVNMSAEPIVNGTIGKIYTQIQSYWGQEIEDVYVEIFIRDETGKQVSQDKSSSIKVKPFDKVTLTNYWDTGQGFEPGDYTGLAILHYLDKNDTAETGLMLAAKPGMFAGYEIVIIIIIAAFAAAGVLLLRRREGKFTQKKLM